MTHILNKEFTFKELFGSAAKMAEGGKMNKDKVEKMVDRIVNGAGWAGVDYIKNFSYDLNKEEMYQVMIELARKRKLYDEEKLTDTELESGSEPKNKNAEVSVKEVQTLYKPKGNSAKQRMKEGGKVDPKSDREDIARITNNANLKDSKYFTDHLKSGVKYKYWHLGEHTSKVIEHFKNKYPDAEVTGDNMWVIIKMPKESAKQRMKQGGIIEASKLKVGMKGTDYGNQPGKIIAIGKVKDFEKIKRYDSSGAMQSAIDEGEIYGIKPEDTLVAVEMESGRGPFVFVYGDDGFTANKK